MILKPRDLPPGVDWYQIPYSPPPPGVTPNFNEKGSPLIDATIAVSVVTIFLDILFLTPRLYTRFVSKNFALDDFCAVSTFVLSVALCGVQLESMGLTAHRGWNVSLGAIASAGAQRSRVIATILVSAALMFGKFCLLSLYRRLFGHIKRVQYQLYGAALLTLPLLVSIIVLPFYVGPPRGQPYGTPNPESFRGLDVTLTLGIMNLIVDLVIFLIPIPVVMRLNLPPRKKNGILAIFMTGSLAIVIDCVTLYYRVEHYKMRPVAAKNEVGTRDQNYEGYIVTTLCIIETCISIICSSMPTGANFWRNHISTSGAFLSLKSRFASNKSRSEEKPELPSFVHFAPATVRQPAPAKRKDPYSINMPTANSDVFETSELVGKPFGREDVHWGTSIVTLRSELLRGNPQGMIGPK